MVEYKVPTGSIFVLQGSKGKVECLSLGDYGQAVNLNQHKPVVNGLPLLPLTEKWVATLSTQYGCSMGCKFCDVPKVGPGINLTCDDLKLQLRTILNREDVPDHSKRLNVHFARMGEPTWNEDVLEFTEHTLAHPDMLSTYNVHPVVSTMMPRGNKKLEPFLHTWMRFKNDLFEGNAGLQLSINSTDEAERAIMFNNNALQLNILALVVKHLKPLGRKITLNFAVAGYTVDTDLLAKLFSPDRFIVKLTPMHKTSSALANSITTSGDYTTPEPYEELEYRFQKSGFETLVFIASEDEDLGRITCGNAILSGSLPNKYSVNVDAVKCLR